MCHSDQPPFRPPPSDGEPKAVVALLLQAYKDNLGGQPLEVTYVLRREKGEGGEGLG